MTATTVDRQGAAPKPAGPWVPSRSVRVPVKTVTGAVTYLTAREVQVLRLIGDGVPTEEIALRMRLSVNTVKSHISRMCQRLGAANRPALVAVGIRAKVIRVSVRPGLRLDPVQRRLVGLVADGRMTAEIAHRLKVSTPSAKYRIEVLEESLGARDRAHLVKLAAEAGWRPRSGGGS